MTEYCASIYFNKVAVLRGEDDELGVYAASVFLLIARIV